uniref:Uncharacterized protein n=1 Tax=Ditylenchus dipsaci TaxID=166011 RepID=A0A915DBB5_9BILA
MNALSSPHCKDTGYFDQFMCQTSNKTYSLPCVSHSKIRTKFHAFAIGSAFSSLIFGLFVKWRKGVIDQKVYTRIQNTIG